MKIGVFTDIHFTESKGYDRRQNGITKRDLNLVNVLNETAKKMIENNVDVIVFGGDLIHEISSLHTHESLFIKNAIVNFQKKVDKPLYIITGNHDIKYYDLEYGSYTSLFEGYPNITVIKDKQYYELVDEKHEAVYYLVSYAKNDEMVGILKDIYNKAINSNYKNKYIIGHFAESQGMTIFNEEINDDIIDFNLIKGYTKEFNKIWLGHLHFRETHGNIEYIGSISTHSFSDKEDLYKGNGRMVNNVGFVVIEGDKDIFISTYDLNAKYIDIKVEDNAENIISIFKERYQDSINYIRLFKTENTNEEDFNQLLLWLKEQENVYSIKIRKNKKDNKNIEQSIHEQMKEIDKIENIVDYFIENGINTFETEKREKALSVIKNLLKEE